MADNDNMEALLVRYKKTFTDVYSRVDMKVFWDSVKHARAFCKREGCTFESWVENAEDLARDELAYFEDWASRLPWPEQKDEGPRPRRRATKEEVKVLTRFSRETLDQKTTEEMSSLEWFAFRRYWFRDRRDRYWVELGYSPDKAKKLAAKDWRNYLEKKMWKMRDLQISKRRAA